MRKVASYADFKKLKSLSFNDFNRWVITLYQQGYEDGQEELKDEIKKQQEVINSKYAKLKEESNCFTEDSLREVLKGIKGIGLKRIEQIIDAVFDFYYDYDIDEIVNDVDSGLDSMGIQLDSIGIQDEKVNEV